MRVNNERSSWTVDLQGVRNAAKSLRLCASAPGNGRKSVEWDAGQGTRELVLARGRGATSPIQSNSVGRVKRVSEISATSLASFANDFGTCIHLAQEDARYFGRGLKVVRLEKNEDRGMT